MKSRGARQFPYEAELDKAIRVNPNSTVPGFWLIITGLGVSLSLVWWSPTLDCVVHTTFGSFDKSVLTDFYWTYSNLWWKWREWFCWGFPFVFFLFFFFCGFMLVTSHLFSLMKASVTHPPSPLFIWHENTQRRKSYCVRLGAYQWVDWSK